MALLPELIMHEQPLSTGASAVYKYKPALERKYRFTSRFGEEILLHRVDKEAGTIHLPRALCPVGKIDERVEGEAVTFPKCPDMRPDQETWFADTVAFLQAGQSGLTVAGTGRGKTVCGYYAAYQLQRKTLVITTKDDIYKQWLDGAQKFLGLAPHEIGEIRGDKCQVEGTKFVVAMIHSLSKEGRYPDWIAKDFGLVIFDEVHRVAAEQFSQVADMFPTRLRLGMSATPERADGKDLLLRAHIGPIRVRAPAELMVPKVLRFKSAWECPRVLRSDPYSGERRIARLPHEPGKTTHIEKMLAADPVRNHLIGQLVNEAYEKGRKIVVFSTLHDHLKSIQRVLTEAHKISGRQIGFYIGAQTKADRERREKEKVKPIVLTTYSMMSEGTSLDWLDTCLLGDAALQRGAAGRPHPPRVS